MAKANRPATPFRGWGMQHKDGVRRRQVLAALLRGQRRAFLARPAAPAGGPDPGEGAREQSQPLHAPQREFGRRVAPNRLQSGF